MHDAALTRAFIHASRRHRGPATLAPILTARAREPV